MPDRLTDEQILSTVEWFEAILARPEQPEGDGDRPAYRKLVAFGREVLALRGEVESHRNGAVDRVKAVGGFIIRAEAAESRCAKLEALVRKTGSLVERAANTGSAHHDLVRDELAAIYAALTTTTEGENDE